MPLAMLGSRTAIGCSRPSMSTRQTSPFGVLTAAIRAFAGITKVSSENTAGGGAAGASGAGGAA